MGHLPAYEFVPPRGFQRCRVVHKSFHRKIIHLNRFDEAQIQLIRRNSF
jgi:hypothetical protein